MRAVDTPLTEPSPRIPDLHRVVPPPADNDVGIAGMILATEDPVAVAGTAVWPEAHPTLHRLN